MREISISAIRTDTLRKMDLRTVEAAMPLRAEKARRSRLERDRLLCLGAGYLMIRALGIRSEAELCFGTHGKPFAPGYPPFSISHSGVWCILATGAQRTVGADIEEISAEHLDLAPSVFTPAELQWMRPNPEVRLFRLWTWKESVMKAAGLGLALSPRSFEVLPFLDGLPVRLLGREWFALDGAVDSFRYAVCADEPIGPARWTEDFGSSFRTDA